MLGMWERYFYDLCTESLELCDRFSDTGLDSYFDPFDEVLFRDAYLDSLEICTIPDLLI